MTTTPSEMESEDHASTHGTGSPLPQLERRGVESSLQLTDCDFGGPRGTLSVVGPYLTRPWREYLQIGSSRKLSSALSMESTFRDPRGLLESSDLPSDSRKLATVALDEYGVTCAVVHAGMASALSGLANDHLAAQLASAANDWLLSEWLAVDKRFVGSIVIAPRNPRLAAMEIERLAANPRIVQVVLSYPPRLLGDRAFEPVFAAAENHGLAIHLHAGGSFTGISRGITGVGYPTSRFEYEVGWTHAGQPHLLSMITEGVFDRHPRLKLVLSGFGIAWLPSLLWCMDMEFHRSRIPPPRRLGGLPSEYVARSVRFTTSLVEVPSAASNLVALLEMVGAQDLLVLGSGYPATDRDPAAALELLPSEWHQSVARDNAERLFSRALAS